MKLGAYKLCMTLNYANERKAEQREMAEFNKKVLKNKFVRPEDLTNKILKIYKASGTKVSETAVMSDLMVPQWGPRMTEFNGRVSENGPKKN